MGRRQRAWWAPAGEGENIVVADEAGCQVGRTQQVFEQNANGDGQAFEREIRLAGEGVKDRGVGGGCGAEGVSRAERIAHAGHGKGSPLSGGGEPHMPGSVARGGAGAS